MSKNILILNISGPVFNDGIIQGYLNRTWYGPQGCAASRAFPDIVYFVFNDYPIIVAVNETNAVTVAEWPFRYI